MKLKLRLLKLRQLLRLMYLRFVGIFKLRARHIAKVSAENAPEVLKPKLRRINLGVLIVLLAITGWVLFPGIRTRFFIEEPIRGGNYHEGIVGSFKNLNPLFSPANDADQSAVALIYSGLMKVSVNSTVVPDLAEKVVVEGDGKVYHVYLRPNLKWQDGQPLTADDVIFTLDAIKNPDTRSPLEQVWRGIKTEKISDTELKVMPPRIGTFMSYLTQPIVPAHLLKKIPFDNLAFYDAFNLSPIGSGPYRFDGLRTLADGQNLELKINENYYGTKPYIETIGLRGYNSEQEAVNGLEKRDVLAIAGLKGKYLRQAQTAARTYSRQLIIKEQTALFMNLKSPKLAELKTRQAITRAIDRTKMVKRDTRTEFGERYLSDAPILPGYLGYSSAVKQLTFDQAQAKSLLGQPLELRLVALKNHEFDDVVDQVVKDLESIGIRVITQRPDLASYQASAIIPRNFDLIIATINMGYDTDPYPYWHSTQIKDPGLNLSQLENTRADSLLDAARRMTDPKAQATKYEEFSKVVVEQVPATWLYGSYYHYVLDNDVRGVVPGDFGRVVEAKDRFAQLGKWYLSTKWVAKKAGNR